jgi:UDP-N-acetyl-D-mannosaminuronate dehydrogenase
VNDGQPGRVVRLIRDELGGSLNGRKVAVLGLAYKPDVDDLRESPAVDVARGLAEAGAEVTACEPYKPNAAIPGVTVTDSLAVALDGADLAALLVGHNALRQLQPGEAAGWMNGRRVVDAVNGWKAAEWQAAGFHVRRLGVSPLR